jgi:hypothetical protein
LVNILATPTNSVLYPAREGAIDLVRDKQFTVPEAEARAGFFSAFVFRAIAMQDDFKPDGDGM